MLSFVQKSKVTLCLFSDNHFTAYNDVSEGNIDGRMYIHHSRGKCESICHSLNYICVCASPRRGIPVVFSEGKNNCTRLQLESLRD